MSFFLFSIFNRICPRKLNEQQFVYYNILIPHIHLFCCLLNARKEIYFWTLVEFNLTVHTIDACLKHFQPAFKPMLIKFHRLKVRSSEFNLKREKERRRKRIKYKTKNEIVIFMHLKVRILTIDILIHRNMP